MSTHLRHGPLSFTICFFTMASKAISGVNRPVLQGEETAHYINSEIPLYIHIYNLADVFIQSDLQMKELNNNCNKSLSHT